MGYEAKSIPLSEAVELVKQLSGQSRDVAEAELRAALREGVVRAAGVLQEVNLLAGVMSSSVDHQPIGPEIWDHDNFAADAAWTYEAGEEVRTIRIRVIRQDIVRIWHPNGYFNAPLLDDHSRAQMSTLSMRYSGGDADRDDMDQIPVLVEGQDGWMRPTNDIRSPNGTADDAPTEGVSPDFRDCGIAPVGRPSQSQWVADRLVERVEGGDKLQEKMAEIARCLCLEYNARVRQKGGRVLTESTVEKVIRPMVMAFRSKHSAAAMREAYAHWLERERARKRSRGN